MNRLDLAHDRIPAQAGHPRLRVGVCGTVHDGQLLQAQGMPHTLAALLGSPEDARFFAATSGPPFTGG